MESPERVKARGRVARQWLLRCLHWLIGPVFLQPLGLQERASPSTPGGGVGAGAVGLAGETRVFMLPFG